MVSINTASIRPSAVEYTRPLGKTADADKPVASTSGAPTISTTSKATATLSAALVTLQEVASGTSFYEQYFPTRDGSPATALMKAVVDPGAVSSSAGLSSKEVATDARARMDAIYDDMAASGQRFDINSMKGKDWYTLFADFDLRSLSVVAGNADGLFSEDEQGMAKSIMSRQQGLAMGLYGGPTAVVSPAVTDHPSHAVRLKAAIDWLDKVPADAKNTLYWADARANAQKGYEIVMNDLGRPTGNVDSGNAVVRLFVKSFDEFVAAGNPFGDRRGWNTQ